MQKRAKANLYRYTTNLYRYRREGFGQKGFLTPFFCTFWHSQPHPPSTKQNPSPFYPLTQATPSLPAPARVSIAQARILLHSSYRRGKLPVIPLESFCDIYYYTWICLVGFGWWFSLLGGLGFRLMLWGGNFCLICTGPARYFWIQVSRTLFYMCGPSVPSLLFFPYLWQDLRILEKAKRLTLLWSGL